MVTIELNDKKDIIIEVEKNEEEINDLNEIENEIMQMKNVIMDKCV